MKKRNVRIILSVLIILAILTGVTVWQNTGFEVTKYTVSSDRLPDEFIGYKIAQISDLHSRKWDGLANAVKAEEPDIILITGDIINRNDTDFTNAVEAVKSLTEIAPVYFSSGNHEKDNVNYGSLKESLSEIGVTVLDGESVTVKSGDGVIRLSAIGDTDIYNNTSTADEVKIRCDTELSELMNENGDFNILMAHHPEYFSLYSSYSVDLIFSGHAHGGAVTLPILGGIWAPGQGFLPQYTDGVYEKDSSAMVVSRGLSSSAELFHFFTPYEIVICTLTQGELDLYK